MDRAMKEEGLDVNQKSQKAVRRRKSRHCIIQYYYVPYLSSGDAFPRGICFDRRYG